MLLFFSIGSKLRIGKIVEQVPSSDEEVRKAKVESEGHVSLHSVVNLRKVEGDDSLSSATNKTVDDVSAGVIVENCDDALHLPADCLRHAATLRAQERWLIHFFLSVK